MMHRDHTLKMAPKKERVYEGRFRHVGGSDSIKCNTFNIIMLPSLITSCQLSASFPRNFFNNFFNSSSASFILMGAVIPGKAIISVLLHKTVPAVIPSVYVAVHHNYD